MTLEVNRIDYNDGRSSLRKALVHDILGESQDAGVSRLIFVTEKDDSEKDHHIECRECQQHLIKEWGWSEHMFQPAVYMSNGYVQETVLDEGTNDERTVKHLRFLVKMVSMTEELKQASRIEYEWIEMTISMRQHQNGSVSIICIGVPKGFHTSFASALSKVTLDRRLGSDGERVAAALIQEIVRLYDESVWKISKIVRRIEKDRFRDKSDFGMMHSLLRHAIHKTEVLEVAVDSLTELSHARLTGIAPTSTVTSSNLMHNQFDFWCRLLQNFQRRSRSNENRLQNEIHLALNLVAQKDSDTTIQLSKSASKDSAAMRTIAVVTLVFLPATFVATLFGMSFFNYQNGGPWSMTSEIWIFWVVAIPLTIITIMVWIGVQVWVHQKSKRKLNQRSKTWLPHKDEDVDLELGPVGDGGDDIELGDRGLSRVKTLYRTWTSGK